MRGSRVGGEGRGSGPLENSNLLNSPIYWIKRDKDSEMEHYSVFAKNYRVRERVNYTEENKTVLQELDHVTIY